MVIDPLTVGPLAIGLNLLAATILIGCCRVLPSKIRYVGALLNVVALAFVATAVDDAADGVLVSQPIGWIPALQLQLQFRLDIIGMTLLLLVVTLSAAVQIYGVWYFRSKAPANANVLLGLLSLFSAVMVGLVLANNVFTLFLFWELTSLLSFALIGFNGRKDRANASALQALLTTGGGGLALLGGLLGIAHIAGSSSFSDWGPLASSAGLSFAVAGVLIGCMTKSAQVPFHYWLPGAMDASTPVSALLHSATMVNAGLVVVARLGPTLSSVSWFVPAATTIGLATFVWGAWRSRQQDDVKLILAYATVLQLGIIFAAFGLVHPVATFSGLAMLISHAVYKAGQFMLVGVVDGVGGTRDRYKISSSFARNRIFLITTLVLGAVAAGLPPLFGYVAKKGFFQQLDAASSPPLVIVVAAMAVIGLGFAVAGVIRFVRSILGVEAREAGHQPEPIDQHHLRHLRSGLIVPTFLACASVGIAVASPMIARFLDGVGSQLVYPPLADPIKSEYLSFKLWSGVSFGLIVGGLGILVGLLLFVWRRQLDLVQRRLHLSNTGSDVYQLVITNLVRTANRVTGVVQHGSLWVYLAVIFLTVLVVPAAWVVANDVGELNLYGYDQWIQALLSLAVVAAAIGVCTARRRFSAALLLGSVGYGIMGLFVTANASDLALTQVLVETVTIVAFVLVLRKLPAHYSPEGGRIRFSIRFVVSALAAVATTLLIVASSAGREQQQLPAVSQSYIELSKTQANSDNVVNAIITDFRGLDTVLELSVLVVAAVGVASLVGLKTGRRSRSTVVNEDRS